MQPYIDWLKEYFARKSDLPENIEQLNYFNAGIIDSFGVIELIESIEQEFKIRFSEDHFQDRRFPTISGLAEIIQELNGRKS